MPRSITASAGKGGVNRAEDVRAVQTLLNENGYQLVPLAGLQVTGRMDPLTIAAIEEFQRRAVHSIRPDGRVDPRGQTLAALNAGARPAPPVPVGAIRVIFQHFGQTPEPTSSSKGPGALYESTVTVSGGVSASVRGSIFPDDMSVKGRIQDGTYDLYLGFHKRSGHTASASDLAARSEGFRAALIVNNDAPVPVISDNPTKTTSEYIHVHNGFKSKRFSDGCPTIHPSDWNTFIGVFLKAYPLLAAWTEKNAYVGKKIGVLEVNG